MKKLLILLLMLIPIHAKAFTSNAVGAVLIDQDSGRVLYAKNAHHTQSVASISNIMTISGQNTLFVENKRIIKHIL